MKDCAPGTRSRSVSALYHRLQCRVTRVVHVQQPTARIDLRGTGAANVVDPRQGTARVAVLTCSSHKSPR